jgi:hypothetical protein
MTLIDELLAFDDHPELLSFRFSFRDLLVLPFIRWGLYSRATDAALGWQQNHAEREPRSLRDRAAFLLRTAWANPLRVDRTFDVVIFGSGIGAVVQQDGRWLDRINDYFAVEYPDRTLIIDSSYRGRYKWPRVPPHVRCGDGFPLWAAARSRLARPHADDEAMLARLIAFLKRDFPIPLDDDVYEQLRAGLSGLAGRLPPLYGLYQRFFARVRPKIIFVEDGSYAGSGYLTLWAREAGVATAEFQHGLIAPSHLAYNYGEALQRNRELATYLPEHVLLYGRYWVDQLRTPSHKVVIGWPHFVRRAAEHRARARGGDTILVISQGTMTASLVELTEALTARLPGRPLIFRLHPGEVPFRERYTRLTKLPHVRISAEGDIYDCFAEAGVVVGHSSTALVEAAALGIPTFILDDEASRLLMPERLGERFASAEDLASALASAAPAAHDPEAFGAADWQANYRRFIERVAR